VQTFDNSIRHIDDTTTRFGAGTGLRARLSDALLGKVSYELATRLPRPDEVFGDGSLTLPNLELLPETSHNANAGFLGEADLGGSSGTIAYEATGFLRHTENMVVELLAQDRVHSIHQNVFSVRTLGVDGVLRWALPSRWLSLQVSSTWQSQRNASDQGPFSPFDGQRVPNRPWWFANAGAEIRIPGLGADNAELRLSLASRYVHEFLPSWEDAGTTDERSRIPDQLTHALGLAYSVTAPWSVTGALDVSNVTNERVFDVLGVQKPGRAASFKLTIGWDAPTAEDPQLQTTTSERRP
jgi:hypothetical protein